MASVTLNDTNTNWAITAKTISPKTGDTLTVNGTSTTATNIAGGAGGSIPYQTAVNTTAFFANGTAGQLLQSNGTTLAPSWTTNGTFVFDDFWYQTPNAGTTTLVTNLGFQPSGTFTQAPRQTGNNNAFSNTTGVLGASSSALANGYCAFNTGSGALFGNMFFTWDALKIGGSATFIFKPFGNSINTDATNAVAYVGFANTFTSFTPTIGIVWKFIYNATTPVWTLYVDNVATGTSYSGSAITNWVKIVITRTSTLGYITTFTNTTTGTGAVTNAGNYTNTSQQFNAGWYWGNNASGTTQKEMNIDYFSMDLNSSR
jgi:hypothetical protein